MEGFQFFLSLYPIWLPLFLGNIFWHLWKEYVQGSFLHSQKYVLLEMRIPREVNKSPLAMEVFIKTLYQTSGESTFIDRYWAGKVRPWFSLEMASFEGQVKFFIWTRETFKNFVESQLYAQYPGIEVQEVPDYAMKVTFDKEKYKLWGCDFQLTKPDVFPIRTYIDYGLEDAAMDEENKTDPLTNVIEFLGSLKAGEQAWIQILIQAHKEKKMHGSWFKKADWKHHAEEEIEAIIHHGSEDGKFNEQRLTSGQKEMIKAIERNIAKQPFECGIRGIYLAEKGKYYKPNEYGLQMALKQYASGTSNGFKPNGKVWLPKFDYPWQDYKDRRKNRSRRRIVEAYKRRSYFHHPYQSSTPFILNTESLATIYHFPGKVVETPTFDRIAAKKAEPPANLPI